MSWAFQAVGHPDKVAAALEANGEKISKDPNNASRQEFEEAKPHLVALVSQNFAAEDRGYTKPVIRISASGSATIEHPGPGEKRKVHGNLSVQIEQLYGWVG